MFYIWLKSRGFLDILAWNWDILVVPIYNIRGGYLKVALMPYMSFLELKRCKSPLTGPLFPTLYFVPPPAWVCGKFRGDSFKVLTPPCSRLEEWSRVGPGSQNEAEAAQEGAPAPRPTWNPSIHKVDLTSTWNSWVMMSLGRRPQLPGVLHTYSPRQWGIQGGAPLQATDPPQEGDPL